LEVAAHEANGFLCVELEPVVERRSWQELAHSMQSILGTLRPQRTIAALADAAAKQMRKLTGYDRVMVYQFHREGHGEVIAECRQPEMEPYLGLHYPASDIPPQARRLYTLQRLRLMVDVDYRPARILALPELAGSTPLDMSYCGLRSVSPMHIEYLKNMGVAASLGVSLILGGELWGMIICHHRVAMQVGKGTRILADMLGQLTSLLVGMAEQAEDDSQRLGRQRLLDSIGEALDMDQPVFAALSARRAQLLALTDATGVCIRLGGELHRLGESPSAADAAVLMKAFGTGISGRARISDEAGRALPDFAHLAATASGALMVKIEGDLDDGILWLRGEAARTVRWGGNPNEARSSDASGERMSPRKSFAAWEEVQRGRSAPWLKSQVEAALAFKRLLTNSLLRRAESALAELGRRDPLTGLPNRRLLLERLSACQSRETFTPACILFLDIDNFKTVNDSLGHAIGDELLLQVGQRLSAVVGDDKLLARLGGDEFVIFCENIGIDEAERLAEDIVKSFGRPFLLEGKPFRTTTSIGIASHGTASANSSDPLRAADSAMYVAKRNGGNQAVLFESPQHEKVLRQLMLEQALFQALEHGQFSLEYQPQFDCASGQMFGFEALLRWRHPYYGNVSPEEFIPLAERSSTILPIGAWVLKEAMRQVAIWQRLFNDELAVSVNVSSLQLVRAGFIETIKEALKAEGIPPGALCLEVTESILMHDAAVANLDQIRALGVRISIDDFGTGYSSLAYLRRLPIDEVKIDKSFLHGVPQEDRKTALLEGIMHMAHTLGLMVVAEGVETKEQWDCLARLGCDHGQGYFLARPLSAEIVEADFLSKITEVSCHAHPGYAKGTELKNRRSRRTDPHSAAPRLAALSSPGEKLRTAPRL
jgi:diguanylate cyclase (GGDEF)-like protein